MFAPKTRVAILWTVAGLLFAAATATFTSRSRAAEPAQPKAKPSKLEEMQKERLESARAYAKQTLQRMKVDPATRPEDVLDAARTVFKAELDLAKTKQERITALENFVKATKENERMMVNLHKVGQGLESVAIKAKVIRLEAEIALEREHEKADKTSSLTPDVKSKPPVKVNAERATAAYAARLQAFESASLFARVSGYVKLQKVDIGDHVKRGDVLAVLDAPELEAQVKQDRAAVDLAKLRVLPAKARLVTAEADLEVGRAALEAAEASLKSATATKLYRDKELKRMQELLRSAVIDKLEVEEVQSRYVAAVEAEQAAKAAVAKAKAELVANRAKLEETKANLAVCEANVIVAKATLEKSVVMLSFATIVSPFDGVVTRRGCNVGDFVQAKGDTPLFEVDRIDIMRVVVWIPERDALGVQVGKPAVLEIDAMPSKKWQLKVSRMAASLNPKDATMRVEFDLANPEGRLLPGLTGRVSMAVDKD